MIDVQSFVLSLHNIHTKENSVNVVHCKDSSSINTIGSDTMRCCKKYLVAVLDQNIPLHHYRSVFGLVDRKNSDSYFLNKGIQTYREYNSN